MGKLANISGREAAKAFQRAGWEPIGQVGSHLVMVRPDIRVNLSIPQHKRTFRWDVAFPDPQRGHDGGRVSCAAVGIDGPGERRGLRRRKAGSRPGSPPRRAPAVPSATSPRRHLPRSPRPSRRHASGRFLPRDAASRKVWSSARTPDSRSSATSTPSAHPLRPERGAQVPRACHTYQPHCCPYLGRSQLQAGKRRMSRATSRLIPGSSRPEDGKRRFFIVEVCQKARLSLPVAG